MSVPERVPEITAVILLFWSGRNQSIGGQSLVRSAGLQPLAEGIDRSDQLTSDSTRSSHEPVRNRIRPTKNERSL